MVNVINFVKNNKVVILKIAGGALSLGGSALIGMASDMQQKIDILKAVKEINKSAK